MKLDRGHVYSVCEVSASGGGGKGNAPNRRANKDTLISVDAIEWCDFILFLVYISFQLSSFHE